MGVEGAARTSTTSSQAPVLLHGRAVESFLFVVFLLQTVSPNWYVGAAPLARMSTGQGTRWCWQKGGLINTIGRVSFGTSFDLHVNYKLS